MVLVTCRIRSTVDVSSSLQLLWLQCSQNTIKNATPLLVLDKKGHVSAYVSIWESSRRCQNNSAHLAAEFVVPSCKGWDTAFNVSLREVNDKALKLERLIQEMSKGCFV